MESRYLDMVSIRYYIYTDTSNVNPCYGSSCVVRGGQTLTHVESDGTATDYTYGIAYLKESTFNGTASNYIINHETGHILGLPDGDGTCPGSIMHSKDYGCSNGYPSWPYEADKNTVNSESNEKSYGGQ